MEFSEFDYTLQQPETNATGESHVADDTHDDDEIAPHDHITVSIDEWDKLHEKLAQLEAQKQRPSRLVIIPPPAPNDQSTQRPVVLQPSQAPVTLSSSQMQAMASHAPIPTYTQTPLIAQAFQAPMNVQVPPTMPSSSVYPSMAMPQFQTPTYSSGGMPQYQIPGYPSAAMSHQSMAMPQFQMPVYPSMSMPQMQTSMPQDQTQYLLQQLLAQQQMNYGAHQLTSSVAIQYTGGYSAQKKPTELEELRE